MGRLFKQLIIAGVYLLIFSGFGWISWQIFYTPTCEDGLQNQGEEGIDCGGPCQSCEIRHLVDPRVSHERFSIDPEGNATDVAIKLVNPNYDWGLKSYDWQIDFLDSSGNTLPGSLYGKSFLMPGATQWLMQTAKFADGRVADINFKMATSTFQWNKLRPYVSSSEFVLRDTEFRLLAPPDIGYAELTGFIENKSSFNTKDVEIQAILYDGERKIVAFGRTTIFTLNSGQQRQFRIYWPKPFPSRNGVVNFDVLSNINFLADESFLQKYGQ